MASFLEYKPLIPLCVENCERFWEHLLLYLCVNFFAIDPEIVLELSPMFHKICRFLFRLDFQDSSITYYARNGNTFLKVFFIAE